jgi:hypothetical protein
MSVDEKKLAKDARKADVELRPFVKSLCGHFQLWNIFTSALKMTEAFARDFNTLSYEAKLAYSKAIIVDYAKPWSSNNSKPLKSLIDENGKITFLESVINNSHTHSALVELRDKLVAHIDHGFEGLGVSIRGATIGNNPQNRTQDPGTLDNVFVPVSIVIENARGIWWIDDPEGIREIEQHLQNCITETQHSLSKLATEFRDKCFEHAHVLNRLEELFQIRELEEKDSDIPYHKNYEFERSSTLNEKFHISNPKETKFGSSRINTLVGRYEPDPSLPSDLDLEGRGYRLIIKDNSNGTVNWNVIFPKYPYPAEKPSEK